MVDLFKTLLIGGALIGCLLVLLKWIERRILARTDSARSFEPFTMEEHLRSPGESGGVAPSDGSAQSAASPAAGSVHQSEEAGARAEATCPCCGQPVKAGE